jgi:hypothetical protein
MAETTSNAEFILKRIAPNIKSKFGIDIEEFLRNPQGFSNDQDIANKIEQIEAELSEDIDEIIKSMGDAQKRFNDDMAKADAVSKKLGQAISIQARQLGIPMITPKDTDGFDNTEMIYVDNADDNTLALAQKLLGMSNFVIGGALTYNEYKVSDWTFATNSKNYAIRINIPSNPVLDMEYAKTEITDAIDAAKGYL